MNIYLTAGALSAHTAKRSAVIPPDSSWLSLAPDFTRYLMDSSLPCRTANVNTDLSSISTAFISAPKIYKLIKSYFAVNKLSKMMSLLRYSYQQQKIFCFNPAYWTILSIDVIMIMSELAHLTQK